MTPKQFSFGTLFHEALAQLYLGVSLEKVMDMVKQEMDPDNDVALLSMIPGYYQKVLGSDLDRFKVLDIEHHFDIAPTTSAGEYLFPVEPTGNYLCDGTPEYAPSLTICGSIDMIVLDETESKIYGFEHKTCKAFRDGTYLWMDEQPRVYTWALQQYIREFNERRQTEYHKKYQEWLQLGSVPATEPRTPREVTLGGVYLNEVKKLLRGFQYQRTLCSYPGDDLDNFMRVFYKTCTECKHMVDTAEYASPQPSYMACKLCSFNSICETYMYSTLDQKKVLDEFCEEFKVREEDHLNEKAERSTETT